MLILLLKIHVVASIIILMAVVSIMTVKIANLDPRIRMSMSKGNIASVDMVIKCFIPVINLLLLVGAITWNKSDLFN